MQQHLTATEVENLAEQHWLGSFAHPSHEGGEYAIHLTPPASTAPETQEPLEESRVGRSRVSYWGALENLRAKLPPARPLPASEQDAIEWLAHRGLVSG